MDELVYKFQFIEQLFTVLTPLYAPFGRSYTKARDIPDGISLVFYVKGRYDAIRAKPVIFRRDIQHFVLMIKTIYPPIDNIPRRGI